MTDQTRDIVERLRRKHSDELKPRPTIAELEALLASKGTEPVCINPDGSVSTGYINPDGPAAADHIEALTKRVAELEGALELIADRAAKLRTGTDDWFELVEFESCARAALSNAARGEEG